MASNFQQPGFLHRFLQMASSQPDTVAIHLLDDEVRVTYGELRAQAEAYNGALESLGAEPHARVLLLLPNGLVLVAMYLAAIGRGAVPVLINDKLTEHEFARLAADAAPTVVVTTAQLLLKHAAALAALPNLRAVATVNPTPELAQPHSFIVTSLVTIETKQLPLQAPQGNPIVTIQYTYKGLGEPLPVAHRYLSLTHSSDGLHAQFHPQGPGSIHLVALPLYAVFGLTGLMVFSLSVGATMLMTNAITRHDIADILSRFRVTYACLVPDIIRVFIKQLDERSTPLPAFAPNLMIYSGGSYLSPDVAEELGKRLGRAPVLQGYGLTECLPILLQSAIGVARPGALGQPIPGIDLRIIDDCGEEVDAGCTGELIVRGPTVAGEYVGKPDASARFFKDGWLHTGDLVWRDADGHVFFVGRHLRITKITAQMVDLVEVESVASTHPDVQRARARVIRDELGRNGLHLSVACASGSTGESILAHLKKHLSAFKLPRAVQMVSAAKEAA